MTDEQIIELMARAICDNDHKGGDFGMTGADAWEEWNAREVYTDRAAAALTALRSAGMAVVPREPTEAMKDAIVDAAQIYDEWGVNKFVSNPMDVYRAMIKTAEGKTE